MQRAGAEVTLEFFCGDVVIGVCIRVSDSHCKQFRQIGRDMTLLEGFVDRVANFATLALIEVEHLFEEAGIDHRAMVLAGFDVLAVRSELWRTTR
jgi:hypothetical protein